MSETVRKSEISYDAWALKPWGFGTIRDIDALHDKYFNKHCEDDKWLHDDCVLMLTLEVEPIAETDEVLTEFVKLAVEFYKSNGIDFKMLGVERYGRKRSKKKYLLAALPRLPHCNDTHHKELIGELWEKALNGRYGEVKLQGYDRTYSFEYLLANTVTCNRDANGYCAFAFVSYGIDSKEIKEISDQLDSRSEWADDWE